MARTIGIETGWVVVALPALGTRTVRCAEVWQSAEADSE